MRKQQVMIIHGGESWETNEDYIRFLEEAEPRDPADDTKKWSHSLADDLGDDYILIAPRMPCRWNAKYDEWKIWFEKHVPFLQEGIILIGNSLGGVFLSKYLSENIFPKKIKSLHLVAAPFGDRSCIKKSSFTIGKSLKKIEQQVPDIHLYHSKDDDIVDFGDFEEYAKAIPSAKKHIFEDRGHFYSMERFAELVDEIKKLQ